MDEPSILHNTTSYLSTNSNSRTRLDLDELDDELHRVTRLDHNLDIVRQQVKRGSHIVIVYIYVSSVLTYPSLGASFIYYDHHGV